MIARFALVLWSVIIDVCVRSGVREPYEGCFNGCESLRRVTFSPSSSLERIGVEAFGLRTLGVVSLRHAAC